MSAGEYVGRFAPSPTGPLHFGSLVAAVASFVDARAHHGRWLVRMEDIDPPREEHGAARQILATLAAWQLQADGPVLFQSTRHDAYHAQVETLLAAGLAYRCSCTRSQLQGYARYPGFCRDRDIRPDEPHAVRIRCNGFSSVFVDAVQGPQQVDIENDVGDFVIWRRDALPAYQLAVTIDDAFQGITDIVRGADLLASTAQQNFLRHLLRLPPIRFAHVPVVCDERGNKLSKQTGATAIQAHNKPAVLCQVLHFLRQTLPPENARQSLTAILEFAINHWDISTLHGVLQQKVESHPDFAAY